MLLDRDLKLLRFMGQWQFMQVDQCARYLGCSEQVARRRLRALKRLGLVTVVVPFADMKQVYWVTAEGIKFVRGVVPANAPKMGPKLSQFEHDRILVNIAVDFAVANPDYEVYGEIEMRRVDAEAVAQNEPTRFAIKRWQAGRHVNVFPDMSAVKAGRRFVIEYEHTRKDRVRLQSLMTAYANSSEVAAIKYYASPVAFPQLSRVYEHLLPNLPIVGGKPKVQIEQHEEGSE